MTALRAHMVHRAARYLAERGEPRPPMRWLLAAYDEWLAVEQARGERLPQDLRQWGLDQYCLNRLTVERLAEARQQAEVRETHRAVRPGLVPLDLLECNACPPPGTPYMADVTRMQDMDALDAAQEIRG